jgi:signal transduction histidine kinase
MFALRTWNGGPQRLIVYFVLLLLLPAGAVVWLGIQLIRQDRVLESRQLQERRESAADLVVAGLEQALSATERGLGALPDRVPASGDGAVFAVFRNGGVELFPEGQVLYYPSVSVEDEKLGEFAAPEQLENRSQDYGKAAAMYRSLAQTSDARIRAGALVRLARNLRKMGQDDDALRVYRALLQFHSVSVDGVPADFVGRRARCVVLHALGRGSELQKEAGLLQQDLLAGRWRLDRDAFFTYVAELESWSGKTLPIPADRAALADAVDWLWRRHNEAPHPDFPPTGRQLLKLGTLNIVVLWQLPLGDGADMTALIAGPRFQQREWFGALNAQSTSRGVHVALAADNTAVFGDLPGDVSTVARRSPAQSRLPWTILVSNADPGADFDGFARRRTMLFGGLAILLTLVVAGGYFILRAASREFAVVQLQSDFVSAVSHEFRTPLTSLRQFTDLLNESDEFPPEERRTFYQAQARATQRLQGLVESLLDFGRIEAGARRYRKEDLPAACFVRDVVEDFQQEPAARGFTIESEIDEDCGVVNGDLEALTRALWNLLDNAVKYSGDSKTIGITASRENGRVAISVRDRGLGIPPREQDEIFRKFVRGAEARRRGIKGTGIGLAMVQHIVRDHGGWMRLESTPGKGSTFTVLLPRKV